VGNGRLLVLDDDAQIGRMIEIIAESAGFEARSLTRIGDFFTAVRQWHPTHIAIDLVMPEMDGVQVLVRLAAMNCAARIIVTSGVGTRVLDAAGRSGNEHGLDIAGVLAKPFSPRALRELLGQPRPHPAAGGRVAHPLGDDGPTAAELAQALGSEQLQIAYQPQVHCASGHFSGVEALVRWDHPQLGELPPDRFIPLAERHELIEGLTFEVVRRALDWFMTNIPATVPCNEPLESPTSLSVNISAIALRDAAFIERLSDHCHETGLDPTRLIFELTETSAMENPVSSLDLLTRLRMKGFQLSIDDFGTGFSSMLQLVRLPFSEIKIDKSFVMTATRSAESLAVVRSVIELGHSLELRVVAEGVEDEATLNLLRQLGCDVAQGYHLGRPVRGAELLAWLARVGALHASPASQGALP
jgi:EAL domain-containing protein (putative c-di-GMP-specific phosphodiesterase class I)